MEESSKLAQKVITACKGVSSVKSCSKSPSLLFDAYVVKGDALSGLGSTEQVHTHYSHMIFPIFLLLAPSLSLSHSLFLTLSLYHSLSLSPCLCLCLCLSLSFYASPFISPLISLNFTLLHPSSSFISSLSLSFPLFFLFLSPEGRKIFCSSSPTRS